MRRHPEIPWRLTEKDVRTELPRLQLTMLKEAAARVAAGGELIYATCSVFDEENTQVVDAFLASPEGTDFSWRPSLRRRFYSCPSSNKPRSSSPYAKMTADSSKCPRKRGFLRRPLLRQTSPQITSKLR
ncbi:MAG: hypothetical protein ACLU0O_09825 [Collinsella sp.]